ncbi:hypothetical protein AB5I41_17455 [Sphingomonas sp. MMS24-JH45]
MDCPISVDDRPLRAAEIDPLAADRDLHDGAPASGAPRSSSVSCSISTGALWSLLARRVARTLRQEFGCHIAPSVRIGAGLQLPHPQGIVLGSAVRIGANCINYHQVTLGVPAAAPMGLDLRQRLGNGVTLFAGAKLIGAITIGDEAIGRMRRSSVTVPANHRAIGVSRTERAVAKRCRAAGQEA